MTTDVEGFSAEMPGFADADIVVGLGREGCDAAIGNASNRQVLCALVTTHYLEQKIDNLPDGANLAGVVMNQPVTRQVAVATRYYPALRDYCLIAERAPQSEDLLDDYRIDFVTYNSQRQLADQVAEVARKADALLIVPDPRIYNRSNLRTVLITAYGHGRPVIGYSKAHVKAGALITTYSSPSHILRQIRELLDKINAGGVVTPGSILAPRYFSIATNDSIAKSLLLTVRDDLVLPETLTDEDIHP